MNENYIFDEGTDMLRKLKTAASRWSDSWLTGVRSDTLLCSSPQELYCSASHPFLTSCNTKINMQCLWCAAGRESTKEPVKNTKNHLKETLILQKDDDILKALIKQKETV